MFSKFVCEVERSEQQHHKMFLPAVLVIFLVDEPLRLAVESTECKPYLHIYYVQC